MTPRSYFTLLALLTNSKDIDKEELFNECSHQDNKTLNKIKKYIHALVYSCQFMFLRNLLPTILESCSKIGVAQLVVGMKETCSCGEQHVGRRKKHPTCKF